jgi:hypothetical protein
MKNELPYNIIRFKTLDEFAGNQRWRLFSEESSGLVRQISRQRTFK